MSERIQQKLLDRSSKHVIKQGKPSSYIDINNGLKCLYKSSDGLSCAAGIFIKSYDEGMENKNWIQVCSTHSGYVIKESFKEQEFVNSVLQAAHDDAAEDYKYKKKSFVNVYISNLKRLVKMWNKEYNTNLKVNI